MKPLNRATQKNVRVNDFAYSREEMEEFEQELGFFHIHGDNDLRLSLDYVSNLKVVLSDYGEYCAAATLKATGEDVYVIL